MESLTFVDETGLAETTFIPETYEPSCDILDRIRMFIVYGKVGEHFGTLTMTVEKVETIKG